MRTIDELLAETPVLGSLTAEHLAAVAGCAQNRGYHAGDQLMREGNPADTFYVVRTGTVALETHVPQRGTVTIETLHDGDLLGWSWLVPPYREQFDVRAVTTVHTIAFDGGCLRGKFDGDPALGYDLMKLFAPVIVERLQATRLRMLDVYAKVPGEPVPGA